MSKKIISIVLTLCLVLTAFFILPMTVGANDPKIQIIGYDGNSITLKPVDGISFGMLKGTENRLANISPSSITNWTTENVLSDFEVGETYVIFAGAGDPIDIVELKEITIGKIIDTTDKNNNYLEAFISDADLYALTEKGDNDILLSGMNLLFNLNSHSDIRKDHADILMEKAQKSGLDFGEAFELEFSREWETDDYDKVDYRALHELNEEIEVSIKLPEKLRNTDEKINREFSIILMHRFDGENEARPVVVPAKYDPATGLLRFKTKLFSTYSITYKDTSASQNLNNGGSSSKKNDTLLNEKIAKTADGNAIFGTTLSVLVTGAAAAYAFKKKRENI